MTDMFTESQMLDALPHLTQFRLTTLIEARIVLPLRTETGPVFRRIDLARIELLCELTENFSLDDDALAVVMSLLDQLHTARRDLRAIAEALAAEDPAVRARIGAALANAY
ncbi:MAG: hypothetical protein H7317_07955 [Pseudorhodobacter sp.]|nr:hypothetical protein [Pseudorhodobacter sp.]